MSQASPTEPQHAPRTLDTTPSGSCPYLGLRLDPATIYALPTDEHRCYARGKAEPIASAYQATTCLAATAVACPRYAEAAASQAPAPADLPPVTALAAPPRPGLVGKPRGLRAALGLVALVALIVVLPLALRGLSLGPQPAPAPSEPAPIVSPAAPGLSSVASGRAAITAPWAQLTPIPDVDGAGEPGVGSAPGVEGDNPSAVENQGTSASEPAPTPPP